MLDVSQRQSPWSACVAFVAGDASKVIKACPAGKILVVTSVFVLIRTAAAQTIDIADTSLTNKLMAFAASAAVGNYPGPSLFVGIPLVAGEDLIYKPAAAGPAGTVIAEGYLKSTGVGN
jgi:hypothetical protein